MWGVFCCFHRRVGLMWFSFVVYYALFSIDVPFIIRFFSNWMSRMNFMLWFVCVAHWSNVKFSKNFFCAIILRRTEKLLNKEWRCCKCFSIKSTCAPFGRWICFACGVSILLLLLLLLDTKCISVLEILLRLVWLLHALAHSLLIQQVFSIWSTQFSTCAIILTHFYCAIHCYVHTPHIHLTKKFLRLFHIIETMFRCWCRNRLSLCRFKQKHRKLRSSFFVVVSSNWTIWTIIFAFLSNIPK